MAKLTKSEVQRHEAAQRLIDGSQTLTIEEAIAVVEDWHEGATHSNTRASAHFTPWELARHAALEVGGRNILDLCSGIGTLALACRDHYFMNPPDSIVMVEINPDYAAVARRIVPEAEVIVGSIYDKGLMAELASRHFDTAISNPPFGTFSKDQSMEGPRYKGDVHYEVIDIASDLADYGVFILPQMAVPFDYSGRQSYSRKDNPRYEKFSARTGITLEAGCGTDTSVLPGFRGVTLVVEIAVSDFQEARSRRDATEMPLFSNAA